MPELTETAPDGARAGETRLAVAIVAACAVVCLVWLVHGWGYLEDDGWIHLEFARSLAAGQGFSFNGHVVYGDTSPMWVWLLRGVHGIVPRWETAAKVLCVLGCGFGLSALWAFARALTRTLPAGRSRVFAALAVAVVVASPYFGYWTFSGMEALTAAGLACWACVLVTRERMSARVFLLAAMCGGLAPLLRPEMSFLTVLVGLVLLARLLRMEVSGGVKAALLVAGLVLIAAPFGLWARYAVHTFGTVLPNTNAAKRAMPNDSVVKRLLTIYGFGFPEALVGVVLLAGWAVVAAVRGRFVEVRRLARAVGAGGLLLVVWTAVNCCFYVANHTYVQTRYIFVTAPLLAVVMLAAAALRWPRLYRAGVALALVLGVGLSALETWPLIRNKVELNARMADLTAYMRTLPPEAPVAVYSIGEIAFLSEHPIVDTGGITRPGVIPYMFDTWPDRQLAWARSQGAQYSLGPVTDVPGAKIVWEEQIPPTGWFTHPAEYRRRFPLQLWTIPPGPSDPAALPDHAPDRP